MIATSVAYDVLLFAHVLAAIGTIVVFVTMRLAALAVANGADGASQATRVPERRNWAARLLHVLPITGLIMVASGGGSVSFSHAWVGVGLVCYLAAAAYMEARTLPAERVLAATIVEKGTAPPALGVALAKSVDVLLVIVAVALITMVVQY